MIHGFSAVSLPAWAKQKFDSLCLCRPFNERNQNYERARERIFESYPDLQAEAIRSTHGLRNGSDGGSSELGKATFRNREQELRDPEFQRFRSAPKRANNVVWQNPCTAFQ